MTVDVEVVVAGEIAMPRAYAIRPSGPRIAALPKVLMPGSASIRAPFLWYLLRHPREGTILVDTGLPAPGEGFGRAAGLLFRGLKPAAETFEEQLRARGVEPAELKLVVMTHLHADHTGGMPLLANAEFVIGRREWRAVTEQNPLKVGAVGDHLPPDDRVRQIDFEADGVPHGPFSSTVDLFGDGSIRLISTPGHNPGHLSVLVERADTPVLIVGDAAYTSESIRDQKLPLMTDDEGRYRRSLAEIKAYADAEPDAVVVPTHDPDAFRRV